MTGILHCRKQRYLVSNFDIPLIFFSSTLEKARVLGTISERIILSFPGSAAGTLCAIPQTPNSELTASEPEFYVLSTWHVVTVLDPELPPPPFHSLMEEVKMWRKSFSKYEQEMRRYGGTLWNCLSESQRCLYPPSTMILHNHPKWGEA